MYFNSFQHGSAIQQSGKWGWKKRNEPQLPDLWKSRWSWPRCWLQRSVPAIGLWRDVRHSKLEHAHTKKHSPRGLRKHWITITLFSVHSLQVKTKSRERCLCLLIVCIATLVLGLIGSALYLTSFQEESGPPHIIFMKSCIYPRW